MDKKSPWSDGLRALLGRLADSGHAPGGVGSCRCVRKVSSGRLRLLPTSKIARSRDEIGIRRSRRVFVFPNGNIRLAWGAHEIADPVAVIPSTCVHWRLEISPPRIPVSSAASITGRRCHPPAASTRCSSSPRKRRFRACSCESFTAGSVPRLNGLASTYPTRMLQLNMARSEPRLRLTPTTPVC